MYKLKLSSKDCISCGICMDVCQPKAIDMRIHRGKTIEGVNLTYIEFDGSYNTDSVTEQMMTFPFMQNAGYCNGCMDCVNECPVHAIEILRDSDIVLE